MLVDYVFFDYFCLEQIVGPDLIGKHQGYEEDYHNQHNPQCHRAGWSIERGQIEPWVDARWKQARE